MNIAVIPARFGSKRIPQKNIKIFNGKPMIAWAIEVAKKSMCFDRVLISSDSQKIIEIAESYGAEALFVRPENLSNDFVTTLPVIEHAINFCIDLGMSIENVCCLYPCSPFITTGDIVESLAILKSNPSKFVYPVCEYHHPIQRAMRRNGFGQMSFVQEQFEITRTQDLERTYYDAGQFYWGNAKSWLTKEKLHSNGIGMSVPNWRCVDIDTHDDWIRAELLFLGLKEYIDKNENII